MLRNNKQLRDDGTPALTQWSPPGADPQALSHSVGDYKLSAGMDVGNGFIGTVAVYGTTKKGYFATDLGAEKSAGKTSLVVSLGKTF